MGIVSSKRTTLLSDSHQLIEINWISLAQMVLVTIPILISSTFPLANLAPVNVGNLSPAAGGNGSSNISIDRLAKQFESLKQVALLNETTSDKEDYPSSVRQLIQHLCLKLDTKQRQVVGIDSQLCSSIFNYPSLISHDSASNDTDVINSRSIDQDHKDCTLMVHLKSLDQDAKNWYHKSGIKNWIEHNVVLTIIIGLAIGLVLLMICCCCCRLCLK